MCLIQSKAILVVNKISNILPAPPHHVMILATRRYTELSDGDGELVAVYKSPKILARKGPKKAPKRLVAVESVRGVAKMSPKIALDSVASVKIVEPIYPIEVKMTRIVWRVNCARSATSETVIWKRVMKKYFLKTNVLSSAKLTVVIKTKKVPSVLFNAIWIAVTWTNMKTE